MPLAMYVPKSDEVEDRLAPQMENIRAKTKKIICDASGFTTTDVQVFLGRCPYRDADPTAADVILFIDTCPHSGFEANATQMVVDLSRLMFDLGLTLGMGAEVWPRFLPGPWAFVQGDQIQEIVAHPRGGSVISPPFFK